MISQPKNGETHNWRDRLGLWISGRNGYDAISHSGKRREIKIRNYPQDAKLAYQGREAAIATTQDGLQNFVSLAWVLRKHLDFVASVKFEPQHEDPRINDSLKSFMQWWDRRNNFDVRRRHSLRRTIRLAESGRTSDGDFGLIKIGGQGVDRGKTEPVEAYRVDDPDSNETEIQNLDRWWKGVEVTSKGSVKRYALHDVDRYGTKTFNRFVPPMNMCWLGYYQREDQYRGISPLLSALNAFTDVEESKQKFLLKQKALAAFAVMFTRDAQYSMGGQPTQDLDGDGIAESVHEMWMEDKPAIVDGNPGDDAKVIESNTPAAEAVDFMRFVTNLAIKALDIPNSFLNEDGTTFHGGTAARNNYMRSVADKQMDLIEWLTELCEWRLGMALGDGQLVEEFGLPAGVTWPEIRDAWKWKPVKQPWWDPVKEATGAKMAIAAGLDNYERAADSNGTDVYENLKINARVVEAAEKLGLDVKTALASSTSASINATTEAPADETPDEEPDDTETETEESDE